MLDVILSQVKWSHERDGKMTEMESRTSRSFQDTKSYLTILQVTANDSGLYYCSVNNKIGQPANASIYLIVKRKSEIYSVSFEFTVLLWEQV